LIWRRRSQHGDLSPASLLGDDRPSDGKG
jgi:hypothetical protein